MQTKSLVIGDVLAQEKDSYNSGKPVLVLDNALWTLGNEWVNDPENPGSRKEVYNFRPAKQGERARHGTYRSSYRDTGVPVLMVEYGYYRWMDTASLENRVVTPAGDILRTAAKQLGLDSDEDMARSNVKGSGTWRTEVVVEMGNGKKASVTVVLAAVRPQTLTCAWKTFLDGKIREERARQEHQAQKDAETARRNGVTAEVTGRLDALLGEAKRHWRGEDRTDCYRSDSGFQISEATLLELLRLAEKGLR